MIITIIAVFMTITICFSFGVLTEILVEKIDRKTVNQMLPIPIILFFGLFLTSLFLMLIHFFVKIDVVVYLVFLCVSIFIFYLERKRVGKIFQRKLFHTKNQWLFLPLIIVSGLILLSHSMDMNYEFDLGLYHLQHIKWDQTYAIVPGLGNLHGRFAFNSNWFLLESLFGNRTLFGKPIFPINVVMIFAFIVYALEVIAIKGRAFFSGKVLLLILFFSTFTLYGYANSSSNDIPCDILIWVILSLFLLKIENNTINVWDKYSWAMVILSVFAFTIKVSSAIILILPGSLIIFAYPHYKKAVIHSVLFSSIYLSVWFLRNLMISGTVIYPVSFLQIGAFDWSIPKNLIAEMAKEIYYWAIEGNLPGNIHVMTFTEKFILWQAHETTFIKSLLFTGVFGSVIFLFYDSISFFKKGNKKNLELISYWVMDTYLVVAFLYWCLSAPDPRFAYGPILASISLGIARVINKINFSKLFIDAVLFVILILSVWIASITLPWQTMQNYILFPPTVPQYSIEELTLADGNIIYIPTEGIQCWDAPLPCSGNVYDGLVMRSTDLADGFAIQK